VTSNWHFPIFSVLTFRRGVLAMNIDLTPELEEFVRQELASGRYGSASEMVCEALRLMDGRDRLSGCGCQQIVSYWQPMMS